MKIKIAVTEDDIKKGRRKESDCCPVALAAGRKFGEKAHVTLRVAQIGSRFFRLGPEVTAFIRNFDSGGPVEPFSFELEA